MKKNILVVDDSKSSHAYLKSLLDAESMELCHAYHGLEAVQIYQKVAKKFDFILLDWEMPEMEGPETAANLREMGYQGPIIMVTTRNSPQDIAYALSKGVSDFIMKPYTKDILLTKIESMGK